MRGRWFIKEWRPFALLATARNESRRCPFPSAQEDVCEFPMAVLEVKLAGEHVSSPPAWIAALTEGPLVAKENAFSKYIHGTYFFNR